MKKKLTITGIFNDALTNYENKESSISMIVDFDEDCQCRAGHVCFLHREIKGYVYTDVEEEPPVSE